MVCNKRSYRQKKYCQIFPSKINSDRKTIKLLQLATLLKLIFLHGCFSRFLNCTNGSKSRKASHISNLLLQPELFLDEMKIATVTSLFKEEINEIWVFEKIMYKRIYKHLIDNNILYKNIGFHEIQSIQHAI